MAHFVIESGAGWVAINNTTFPKSTLRLKTFGTGGVYVLGPDTKFNMNQEDTYNINGAAFDPTDQDDLLDELRSLFFLVKEYNIVLDGNSMLNGVQTSEPTINSPASIIANKLGAGFPNQKLFVTNASVGNQCIYTEIPATTAIPSKHNAYDSVIAPLKSATRRNVIVVWEQLNELYYSKSKSNTQTRLQNYCNLLKANGWEVIVATVTARDSTANSGFLNTPGGGDDTNGQTIIQAMVEVNTWIRANYTSFAHGLIDLTDDTFWTNYPNDNVSKFYSADGVHWSDYGAFLAGNVMVDDILAFLGQTAPDPFYVVDNTAVLTTYKSTAGITVTAEVNAINTAFSSLSTEGMWQYIEHWYPLLGDNANGYKVDAKTPGSNALIAINPGGGTDILSFNKTTGLSTRNEARVEVPKLASTLKKTSYGVFYYTNFHTAGGTPYVQGTASCYTQFFGADLRVDSFKNATTTKAMNFPPYTGVDFYGHSRNMVDRHIVVRDSVDTTIDEKIKLTVSTPTTTNIPFGCYYHDNTPTIFPAGVQLRFVQIVITKGLPAAKIITLHNILHTLETALGRSYTQLHN